MQIARAAVSLIEELKQEHGSEGETQFPVALSNSVTGTIIAALEMLRGVAAETHVILPIENLARDIYLAVCDDGGEGSIEDFAYPDSVILNGTFNFEKIAQNLRELGSTGHDRDIH